MDSKTPLTTTTTIHYVSQVCIFQFLTPFTLKMMTLVGHLGLQSMSYRVGTPCISFFYSTMCIRTHGRLKRAHRRGLSASHQPFGWTTFLIFPLCALLRQPQLHKKIVFRGDLLRNSFYFINCDPILTVRQRAILGRVKSNMKGRHFISSFLYLPIYRITLD